MCAGVFYALAARCADGARLIAAFARTFLNCWRLVRHRAADRCARCGPDEIAHAPGVLCAGVGVRGEAAGPQAFSQVQKNDPSRRPFVTWARETFEDGCVGETIAAATALKRHSAPTIQPSARCFTALRKTRRDTPSWHGKSPLCTYARRGLCCRFDSAQVGLLSFVPASLMTADSDAGFGEHGILSPSVHAALRSDVIHWSCGPVSKYCSAHCLGMQLRRRSHEAGGQSGPETAKQTIAPARTELCGLRRNRCRLPG